MPYFYSWVGQTTGGSGSADKISRGFITNNMEPNHEQTQEEIYRLVKENNKMLHGMRRTAFWGGLFKLLIWAGLIAAPIWLYSVYLAPIVQNLQQTMNQVQGVSSQAQGQLNGLGDVFKQLEAKLKSALPANQ